MKLRLSTRLLIWALAVCSVLCIATGVRIEYLNYRAGGAIQRKAKQEPHSKWRIGDGYFAARAEVEAEWRKENGVDRGTHLSPSDYEAIRERLRTTEWSPSPRDRLGELLGSWGLLQYPLAAFLILASLVAAASLPTSGPIPRWALYVPAIVGLLALGLAFYRGYFTSLGW
jgi:hypothetical protein